MCFLWGGSSWVSRSFYNAVGVRDLPQINIILLAICLYRGGFASAEGHVGNCEHVATTATPPHTQVAIASYVTAATRCLQFIHLSLVSSFPDDVEEVIYSQCEAYPEEPFDSSWESNEDSKSDEKYTLPSGWI